MERYTKRLQPPNMVPNRHPGVRYGRLPNALASEIVSREDGVKLVSEPCDSAGCFRDLAWQHPDSRWIRRDSEGRCCRQSGNDAAWLICMAASVVSTFNVRLRRPVDGVVDLAVGRIASRGLTKIHIPKSPTLANRCLTADPLSGYRL